MLLTGPVSECVFLNKPPWVSNSEVPSFSSFQSHPALPSLSFPSSYEIQNYLPVVSLLDAGFRGRRPHLTHLPVPATSSRRGLNLQNPRAMLPQESLAFPRVEKLLLLCPLVICALRSWGRKLHLNMTVACSAKAPLKV